MRDRATMEADQGFLELLGELWGSPGLGRSGAQALAAGERDENTLTNLVFFERHPELGGRRIRADERELAREWLQIRDMVVRPALRAGIPPTSGGGQPRGDTWIKAQWADYRCQDGLMVTIPLLSNAVQVNAEAVEAFGRLAETLRGKGYRAGSTGGYNCRPVKDGTAWSLHSYGLAVDIDAACNPWLPDQSGLVRFSARASQTERCQDVKAGRADTSFTQAQIAAAEAIRTVDGLRVFQWGGRWRSIKDSMHFQIDLSPSELERGIAST